MELLRAAVKADIPDVATVVEGRYAAAVASLAFAVGGLSRAAVKADIPGAALAVELLRAGVEALAAFVVEVLPRAAVAEPPGVAAVALLPDLSFATLVELAHCDRPRGVH